ncbi:unnamed protein product [Zymoseptoria tritici ST99CH_3D1]|nr:unnamed protein product [Zymoseptoria tritici ST99CH_3D1]
MFDWIQLRFQSGVLLQTAYANDFLRQKLRSTGQGRLHMAFETQERIGLEGLSYDLIDRATGRDPWVSPIRDGGGQATGTGGFSAWPNTWETRIQLLFDWDDGFPRT